MSYEAIGVRLPESELRAAIDQVWSDPAVTRDAVEGGFYLRWEMGGGAELWIVVHESGDLLDATPYLAPDTRFPMRLAGRATEPDERGLTGIYLGRAARAVAADARVHPIVFEVPDFARAPFSAARVFDVALSALADRIEVYPPEATQVPWPPQAADAPVPVPHFADRELIPAAALGLRGPDPAAGTLLYGRVVSTRTRRNAVTGSDFFWARVATVGGEVEVAAAPSVVTGAVTPGCIVGGPVQLAGRVFER